MPLVMAIERFGVGKLRSYHRPAGRLGRDLVRIDVNAV